MKNQITTAEYNDIKQYSIENQPVTSTVRLSDIQLAPDSHKNEYAIIKGVNVPVTKGFFSDLSTILNINAKLRKDVNDTDTLPLLIEALRSNRTRFGNMNLTLSGNPKTKAVSGIYKNYGRLSNQSLFDQAEKLMNDGLILHNVNGGINPTVQLLSPNQEIFKGFGDSESFHFGITLGNNGSSTQLGDFAYRLICGNGAMGLSTDFKYNLTNNDSKSFHTFLMGLDHYRKNGFIPTDFETKLNLGNSVYASLFEIENAFKVVENSLQESDKENKLLYKETLKHKWFHGIPQTEERLRTNKIDPNKLTNEQKKYIRTGQTIWDVINSMTNLGSNDHVEPINNKLNLQKNAGKLFASDWNLQHANLLLV